jgi:hypothetical protein
LRHIFQEPCIVDMICQILFSFCYFDEIRYHFRD